MNMTVPNGRGGRFDSFSSRQRQDSCSTPPSRHHLQQIQRVQYDLVNLTNTQREDSRDLQELRDDVRLMKGKVDALLASSQVQSSSRHKLPPPLSHKVRIIHSSLENQFDPSLPYNDPVNCAVALELTEQMQDSEFEPQLIKRGIYRYYESRRKAYNDGQPQRLVKAAANKKNSRKKQEKMRVSRNILHIIVYMLYMSLQLLDRRSKVVQEREVRVWSHMTKDCMSEESDNEEDGTKTRHRPKWRSERLNTFISKLDEWMVTPEHNSRLEHSQESSLPSTPSTTGSTLTTTPSNSADDSYYGPMYTFDHDVDISDAEL